jgi:hypothetical protein
LRFKQRDTDASFVSFVYNYLSVPRATYPYPNYQTFTGEARISLRKFNRPREAADPTTSNLLLLLGLDLAPEGTFKKKITTTRPDEEK